MSLIDSTAPSGPNVACCYQTVASVDNNVCLRSLDQRTMNTENCCFPLRALLFLFANHLSWIIIIIPNGVSKCICFFCLNKQLCVARMLEELAAESCVYVQSNTPAAVASPPLTCRWSGSRARPLLCERCLSGCLREPSGTEQNPCRWSDTFLSPLRDTDSALRRKKKTHRQAEKLHSVIDRLFVNYHFCLTWTVSFAWFICWSSLPCSLPLQDHGKFCWSQSKLL